jgi:phenylacetate-CoA ligase
MRVILMTGIREGLLGPSYFRHRRLIAQSKSWSTEEIRAYQSRRLSRLLSRYGDAPTTRQDYRLAPAHYSRFCWPIFTHAVRTGGTSGEPLQFRADTFARRQKERAYLFDVWSQIGYKPHDMRVSYRGNVHAGLLNFDALENVWYISPNRTVAREINRLRRWLRSLEPFFLQVYPSSLFSFIELIGDDLFSSLPLRGVLAGSEAFLVGQQTRFEQKFGMQVAHWYGHTEYAVLAYNCRHCRGFHFYPTYGYAHFAPSGVPGLHKIVASSFNRIGTQFVRYDTGDLAQTATADCKSDAFPRVGAIVGRSQEIFTDDAGRRRALGPYIFGIHGGFWDEIYDVQFVQERQGTLLVQLVARPGGRRSLIEDTLTERIPMARLEFRYVASIERNSNGKRKYFVDHLNGCV